MGMQHAYAATLRKLAERSEPAAASVPLSAETEATQQNQNADLLARMVIRRYERAVRDEQDAVKAGDYIQAGNAQLRSQELAAAAITACRVIDRDYGTLEGEAAPAVSREASDAPLESTLRAIIEPLVEDALLFGKGEVTTGDWIAGLTDRLVLAVSSAPTGEKP
jgi:hypothetical protein